MRRADTTTTTTSTPSIWLTHRGETRGHVDLYLLLQGQLSLQTDSNHRISDRELVRKLGALFDDHRVTAVQKLVSKHEVLLPVFHHVLWIIIQFQAVGSDVQYHTIRYVLIQYNTIRYNKICVIQIQYTRVSQKAPRQMVLFFICLWIVFDLPS